MNKKDIKTYILINKGKIQGVGFSHWFSDTLITLSLNGYVQNS
jgi:acylphosphatase